jgi:uncharacterized DUF497 family protein
LFVYADLYIQYVSGECVRFDWDETKNAINQRKHGVDFDTAAAVFDDPFQLPVFERIVEGEERWQTIGMAGDVLLLLVAHTLEDDEGEEFVRIVSARRATPRERRRYEEAF